MIEAHVRLYAILHEIDPETGDRRMFQSHQMRLSQPSDELGSMLLLMLPSRVVHQIDAWSPLLPPSMLPKAPEGSSLSSYHFPEVRQRQMDSDQGMRLIVECAVTGEGFSTEAAHKAHHTNCNMPYPCQSTAVHPVMTDAEKMEAMEAHFEANELEILVVVEGIDPTCSQTLQSCYSYKNPDIKFGTHDFVECTSRCKDTGRVKIDFQDFHKLKEL